MYKHGWYQVAYEHELTEPITPVAIGSSHRLILVRMDDRIRAFSADCPHRGAHLGYGGKLRQNAIICPFHAYRVGLGNQSEHGFAVPEFETFVVGGLVFVRLSSTHDNGFVDFMNKLAETHAIVPGIVMEANTTVAMVTENGFDRRHFTAVHGIAATSEFSVYSGTKGDLIVESSFEVYNAAWLKTRRGPRTRTVQYASHTFSPGVIVVKLDGENPYKMITGTTARPKGGCVIRLSLILPIDVHGDPPDRQLCDNLLKFNRQAIEDDRVMWENLSALVPPKFTDQDAPILKFHEFCEAFAS